MKSPRPQDRVRGRNPYGGAAGGEVGRRGGHLRQDESAGEPEAREGGLPGRREGHKVQQRCAREHPDLGTGEILDRIPDLAVVGDLRQNEQEGGRNGDEPDPNGDGPAQSRARRTPGAGSGRRHGLLGAHGPHRKLPAVPESDLNQSDRFLVEQLVRPIVNLYRVTPLAAGETLAGPPVAFARQRRWPSARTSASSPTRTRRRRSSGSRPGA